MLDFTIDLIENAHPSERVLARRQLDSFIREISNEISMGYVDYYARAKGDVLRGQFPKILINAYDPKHLGDTTMIDPTVELSWEQLHELAEYALDAHDFTGEVEDRLIEIIEEAKSAELLNVFDLEEHDYETLALIGDWEEANTDGWFDYEISEYGYTFTSAEQINRCANDLGLEVK